MKQQINLLRVTESEHEPHYFSSIHIILGLFLSITISLLIYVYGNHTLEQGHAELNDLKQQQQTLTRVLQDINPTNIISESIDERLDALKIEKTGAVKLKGVINKAIIPGKPASSYFDGLTKNILPGLWLTDINVNRSQNSITLKGRAENSELVPKYIKQFTNNHAFSDIVFHNINVEKNEGDINYTFELGTTLNAMDR